MNRAEFYDLCCAYRDAKAGDLMKIRECYENLCSFVEKEERKHTAKASLEIGRRAVSELECDKLREALSKMNYLLEGAAGKSYSDWETTFAQCRVIVRDAINA